MALTKNIAGIQVYLTTNPNEADEWIKKLHICGNCKNYTKNSLFDGICGGIGDYEPFSPPFNVDYDNVCEYFFTDKTTEYWLQKLGEIFREYSKINDEIRIFFQKEIKPLRT